MINLSVCPTSRTIALAACLLLCIVTYAPRAAHGNELATVFTYRSPESEQDSRYAYDTAILQLALEKTKNKYGDYKLEPSPKMTFARAKLSIEQNKYTNFFIQLSYNESLTTQHNMTFVEFPVDLGIVGYRVCFTHPQTKQRLKSVRTLDDLRQFSIGQGSNWSDTKILRHNGFKVIEVADYETLFQMTAADRFDLFCRGTNELLEEFESHKDIANLSYDETFALAYPLPRFFYTHQSNKKAAERIKEGLLAAYRDGSLQVLWRKNYQRSIDFVKLEKRKIFWIENPLLVNLEFNYKQFFYDPLRDKIPTKTPSSFKRQP